MLLTIHNLPLNTQYCDIKELIISKCGLRDSIVDNLVPEGNGLRVTVGVMEEEDAAILVRKINGLHYKGHQLYVQDKRQKKESEQPYRATMMNQNRYQYQNQQPQHLNQRPLHQNQQPLHQNQQPLRQNQQPQQQNQQYMMQPAQQYTSQMHAMNNMVMYPNMGNWYPNVGTVGMDQQSVQSAYMAYGNQQQQALAQHQGVEYGHQGVEYYGLPQGGDNSLAQTEEDGSGAQDQGTGWDQSNDVSGIGRRRLDLSPPLDRSVSNQDAKRTKWEPKQDRWDHLERPTRDGLRDDGRVSRSLDQSDQLNQGSGSRRGRSRERSYRDEPNRKRRWDEPERGSERRDPPLIEPPFNRNLPRTAFDEGINRVFYDMCLNVRLDRELSSTSVLKRALRQLISMRVTDFSGHENMPADQIFNTYRRKYLAALDFRALQVVKRIIAERGEDADYTEHLTQLVKSSDRSSHPRDDRQRFDNQDLRNKQNPRYESNQSSRHENSRSSRFDDNRRSRNDDNRGSRFNDNRSSRLDDSRSSHFDSNQSFESNQSSRFEDNSSHQSKKSRFEDEQTLRDRSSTYIPPKPRPGYAPMTRIREHKALCTKAMMEILTESMTYMKIANEMQGPSPLKSIMRKLISYRVADIAGDELMDPRVIHQAYRHKYPRLSDFDMYLSIKNMVSVRILEGEELKNFLSKFIKPTHRPSDDQTAPESQPSSSTGPPKPANNAPKPTNNAPTPTQNAPNPTQNPPRPTFNAPNPTQNAPKGPYNAPNPTQIAPRPTYTPNPQNAPRPAFNQTNQSNIGPRPAFNAPNQPISQRIPLNVPNPQSNPRPRFTPNTSQNAPTPKGIYPVLNPPRPSNPRPAFNAPSNAPKPFQTPPKSQSKNTLPSPQKLPSNLYPDDGPLTLVPPSCSNVSPQPQPENVTTEKQLLKKEIRSCSFRAATHIFHEMVDRLNIHALVLPGGILLGNVLRKAIQVRVSNLINKALPLDEVLRLYAEKYPPSEDKKFYNQVKHRVHTCGKFNQKKVDPHTIIWMTRELVKDSKPGNLPAPKLTKKEKQAKRQLKAAEAALALPNAGPTAGPTAGPSAGVIPSYPLGNKKIASMQKRQSKLEQQTLPTFNMTPALDKALISEITKIGNIMSNEWSMPKNATERAVLAKVNKQECVEHCQRFIAHHISKRLTNNGMKMCRIYGQPKPPKRTQLMPFLNKYKCLSVKKSVKSPFLTATFHNYDTVDKLCSMAPINIDGNLVSFKPMNVAPPKKRFCQQSGKAQRKKYVKSLIENSKVNLLDKDWPIQDEQEKQAKAAMVSNDAAEFSDDVIIVENDNNTIDLSQDDEPEITAVGQENTAAVQENSATVQDNLAVNNENAKENKSENVDEALKDNTTDNEEDHEFLHEDFQVIDEVRESDNDENDDSKQNDESQDNDVDNQQNDNENQQNDIENQENENEIDDDWDQNGEDWDQNGEDWDVDENAEEEKKADTSSNFGEIANIIEGIDDILDDENGDGDGDGEVEAAGNEDIHLAEVDFDEDDLEDY